MCGVVKKRKPNRLRGYDYSQEGYYFVTLCCHNHQEWFGKIEEGRMMLNEWGSIAFACWNNLVRHYSNVRLDEFVIMPNHVHGIVVSVGNGLKPFPTEKKMHGLSEIIRGFKTFSARKINERIKTIAKFYWQKSFYDHIVRGEISLNRIREYIINNPLTWDLDVENNQSQRYGDKQYYEMITKG